MNDTHLTTGEIIDHLHGELAPDRDAAVRAHLGECAVCAEERDAEVALTQMLRAHAAAQERELPAGVIASIHAAIGRREPTFWERLSAAFRPAVAVPVAIALVTFVYFGFRATHAPVRAATVDAAYYVDSHAALAAATPLSDEDSPATLPADGDASH